MTMAEYIEREAVKAAIKKRLGTGDLFESRFVFDIDAILAADVAPAVHGRWIPFHSTAAGDIQYCSACDIGCTWMSNYCPNCGARMDGE